MKRYVMALVLVFSFWNAFSQDNCDYKIQVQTEEEIFKLTKEQLVEYMLAPKESVFIYFALMRQNDYPSLLLQVSLNAVEMPPILCFDGKSRVTFKLVDGSYVSLPYLDEINCGVQTEHANRLNNSLSEAAFFIDSTASDRLKRTEIESMRITSMNEHFDISFQKVLSNKDIVVPIYPREYFINTLGCIE